MMMATEADLLQLSPPSSLGGGRGLCGGLSSNYQPLLGNSSVLASGGITNGGPTYRAKPGHCNGTVSSSNGHSNSADMGMINVPPQFMHLPVSTASLVSTNQLHHYPPSATAANILSDENESDHSPSMLHHHHHSITSPKIRKSFGSRIAGQMGRDSPPTKTIGGGHADHNMEHQQHSYLPGDTVDGIPTLSPPPYKSSSTTGSNSSDHERERGGKLTSFSVVKRGTAGSGLFADSNILTQRAKQDAEKQMMSSPSAADAQLISLPKPSGILLSSSARYNKYIVMSFVALIYFSAAYGDYWFEISADNESNSQSR